MKVLISAYYEFMKNMRDIKMVVCLLVFPIIITYILGNALGGYLLTDIKDKIQVGYVNQDSGVIGKEFDKFLKNNEIQKRITLVEFTDRAMSQRAVDEGKVDAVIYVPHDLTETVQEGNKARIELFGKQNVEFVESLAGSFVSTYDAVNAVLSVGAIPSKPEKGNVIERIHYTKDSKMPDIMDYYALLELLNVLILGAIFGVMIVTKQDNSDMHIRTHSLPTSRYTLILGRILGSSAFLFAISTVIVLFTRYAYGVNWDGNILVILGTLFTFSTISVGLGVLIGLIIPGFATSLMVILMLTMFFGIVSGAISPTVADGIIAMLSPNYHAKIIIFGSIYKYPTSVIMESVIWLAGFITVIYGTSAALIRRRKYDNI